VTRAELQRAFGIAFERSEPADESCFWLSKAGEPRAAITVGALRSSAKTIAAGKRAELAIAGTTTLRGAGDLALYRAEDGEGGSKTVSLLVFDGNAYARLAGSVEGVPPTAAAMKPLARALAARM
jgi:hypothetical protein